MAADSLLKMGYLLEDLGRPQDRLPPVIHIGGTNGKGSVASFSQRLLETSGLSVHVHTSPHLIRWNERFRLGVKGGRGRLVEDVELLDVFRRVRRVKSAQNLTIFELSIATALVLFSKYPADCAIIEVGLGGSLDATNIIEKVAVSVITSISLDHEKILGNTVSAIAKDKSGIIKPGCPVVIGHQVYDEVREILVSKAEKMGCPYNVYGYDFYAFEKNKCLVYQDKISQTNLTVLGLVGEHQYINAATAICAVQMAGFTLEKECINAALQSVQWFGRLQKITEGPLLNKLPDHSEVWIDGGHNPNAGLVVSKEISKLKGSSNKPFYLVIGMVEGKKYGRYLEAFVELSPIVLSVSLICRGRERQSISITPKVLMQEAKKLGFQAMACSSMIEALSRVRKINEELPPPLILIAGSLYLAGEALRENGVRIN
ncbi:folylpolyglutamate synthase/dihydrofolate synthase family protein [Candidatus Liberibacter asiaticus]